VSFEERAKQRGMLLCHKSFKVFVGGRDRPGNSVIDNEMEKEYITVLCKRSGDITKGSVVSGFRMILPLMAALLVLGIGCEAGRDRAVNGTFFDRKAGGLGQAGARVDSVNNFGGAFSAPANALAGTYGGTSAFAVFKFARPTTSVLAGLQKARVVFYVSKIWNQGERSFDIFSTITAWNDSTRLDRTQYIGGLGAPLASWSDTASTVNTMMFDLGPESADLVRSWTDAGAFLLKEAPGSNAMVNVYTAFSSTPPTIEYISLISGVSDTTRIKSSSSAYAFDTGLSAITTPRRGVISDGNAGGFVLYLSLPDSFAKSSMVNSGSLVLPIARNDIPSGENLNLEAALLTTGFYTLPGAKTSSDLKSDHLISPTDVSVTIDITGMINAWAASPTQNFGILFKPTAVGSSPAQLIFVLPDSVGISFTTIPEER
jgi:hypothetical protein